MAKWLDTTHRSVREELCLNVHNYDYMRNVMDIMDPNHRIFECGKTITHMCVYSNDINIIRMVLDHGGDPNEKDNYGLTPTDLCILRRPAYLDLIRSYGGIINF